MKSRPNQCKCRGCGKWMLLSDAFTKNFDEDGETWSGWFHAACMRGTDCVMRGKLYPIPPKPG